MPDNQDFTLKIRVLDAQGQFRGGTVDVEIKHRTLSDRAQQRALDASREINIAGLRRAPSGDYQITVAPTDVFKPQSQFVNIPASGFATMTVTIDRVRTPGSTFVVKGSVRTAAGSPFAHGLVRATHQIDSVLALLGEGKTDNHGDYVIKYSSETVSGDIFLRVQVFDERGGVLATSNIIPRALPIQEVDLVIKSPEPVDEKFFIVRGTVRDANTHLTAGVMVRAFDRDLRSEELLGETFTDAKGGYEILYKPEQFRRVEKGNADLLVRAYDSVGKELTASPVLFNANPVEVIDLTIERDKLRPLSEYERYITDLDPLLEGLPLSRLTIEDVTFLAGETRIRSTAHRLPRLFAPLVD